MPRQKLSQPEAYIPGPDSKAKRDRDWEKRQRTGDYCTVTYRHVPLTTRDQLTGLFNRQHFMTELESAVMRATEGKGKQALLLIEPDHYENLLAEVGLATADDLIRGVADRLKGALDEHTLVARMSDHGFAVLCQDHDHTQSQAQADRIREAFKDHILELGERSVNLSVSVGGVQIGERIASVTQVMAKSSQCLASCEGMGGNRTEIFDPVSSLVQ